MTVVREMLDNGQANQVFGTVKDQLADEEQLSRVFKTLNKAA